MALEVGAQPYGHWSGCHAIAWDARRRRRGDLELTQPAVAAGLSARHRGQPRRRALRRRGRRLPQLHLRALRRGDPRAAGRGRVPALRRQDAPAAAHGRVRRAGRHRRRGRHDRGAGRARWRSTPARARRHRADVQRRRDQPPFDPPSRRRARRTGSSPPKTNWAQPLDTPPYYGFPVTCGITFTFGGVTIDEHARVLERAGRAIPAVRGRRARRRPLLPQLPGRHRPDGGIRVRLPGGHHRPPSRPSTRRARWREPAARTGDSNKTR